MNIVLEAYVRHIENLALLMCRAMDGGASPRLLAAAARRRAEEAR
jgi:hypothetical protein